MSVEFGRWVEALRERYGKMAQIAEMIGMSESGFVRGVKAGTLATENVLALARATDAQPSELLHLADKGDVAALIEELYGPATDITPSEREVVMLLRRVPEMRAALLVLLRAPAEVVAQVDEQRGRSPSARRTRDRRGQVAPKGPHPTTETTDR